MRYRRWLSLLGIFLFVNSYAEQQSEIEKKAWRAINNKDYQHAIRLLDRWTLTNPNDTNAQYLLARAYAWNKESDKAIPLLDQLLKQFPNNSDYLLSKATFLSWQDKIETAIRLLQKARSLNPEYQDVWKLEITLRQRSANINDNKELNKLIAQYEKQFRDNSFSKPVVNKPSHAFGIGYTHDRLDNNSPDWNSYAINYSKENLKDRYTLQADFHKRFNIDDQQFSFEYLRKDLHNYQLQSTVSIGTQQILLPNWTAALQVNRKLEYLGIAEAFYKHSTYKSVNTDVIRLAYAKLWKYFEPKLHGILTFFDTDKEITAGYILQVTYYHSDNILLRISYSENTELEYTPTGQTRYQIQNLSLDGRISLSKNLALSIAINQHNQGLAYQKYGIYTGLRYRY